MMLRHASRFSGQRKLVETTMKGLAIAAALCLIASAVAAETPAQTPTCKAQATDKKLAGAALNSFMTKCQKDATASCDTAAADKKLAGAAKTSFTKKCVTDAVGN
jgi:hypothetical protein